MEGWESLAGWWREELAGDPAYREDVLPMLLGLARPESGEHWLDVGCGEGRVMAALAGAGARPSGCDLSSELLAAARHHGPVFRVHLPELGCVRPGSFDGATVCLVLEHVPDEGRFFEGLAGTVRRGGILALVMNHPVFTAPGSAPVIEEDGEVLWRPGRYFGRGHTDEPAGEATVRFYHRTTARMLSAAAAAGWELEELEERGPSAAQVERVPDLLGQEHMPRLLGARWRRVDH